MASVKELFESREGTEQGVYGSPNAPRLWAVNLDSAVDDPVRTIRSLGYIEGDAHPWVNVGTVLLFFRIGKRQTPTRYLVQGFYGPPLALQISRNSKWDVRLHGSVETEVLYYDLDGKPIGSAEYEQTTDANAPFRCAGQNGVTVSLKLKSGGTDPFAPNIPRNITGESRRKPVGSLTMTKTVTGFHSVAISGAMSARGVVNNDDLIVNSTYGPDFFVAQSGTLLLVDVLTEPIVQQSGGLVILNPDGTTPPNTQVTLSMIHNAEGWQLKKPHVKVWDNGVQSTIVYAQSNQRVEEEFRMQNASSLTVVVEAFN